MKYLLPVQHDLYQNEKAQNFLKFGTFDIPIMSISILLLKKIMKYLPPVKPKLVPKLKVLRIY